MRHRRDWLRAYQDGKRRRPSSWRGMHERALEIVPLTALREHSVDVPADPSALEGHCDKDAAGRRASRRSGRPIA